MAASTQSGHLNLTSKYAHTGSKLLSGPSALSSLKTQVSTISTTMSRSVSRVDDKEGPLSSSSLSTLSGNSTSNLHAATSTAMSGSNLHAATSTAMSGSNLQSREKLSGLSAKLVSSRKLNGENEQPSLHKTSFSKPKSLTSGSTGRSSLLTSGSTGRSSLLTSGSPSLVTSGRTSLLTSGSTGRSSLLNKDLGRSNLATSSLRNLTQPTIKTASVQPEPYAMRTTGSSANPSALCTQRAPVASLSPPCTLTSGLVSSRLVSKTSLTGLCSKKPSSHVRPTLSSKLTNKGSVTTQTSFTKPALSANKAFVSQSPAGNKDKSLVSHSLTGSKDKSLVSQSLTGSKDKSLVSQSLTGSKVVTHKSTVPEPESAVSMFAKPITEETEGAPRYDFSSSLASKTTKKALFVSPDLDSSIQTPPTPAVDVQALKTTLLNTVAASLLQSPDFRNPEDPSHKLLSSLGGKLSRYDPEFILKLAAYTRLSLNIRITANFLLALAAKLTQCRPYLKKYFSATIRLPSDWIEVAEIYQAFRDEHKAGTIPTALRKVMASRFTGFDAYQLGKYNKDTSKKKKKTTKKPTKEVNMSGKAMKLLFKSEFPALNNEESDDSADDDDSSVVVSDSETKEEIERLSFTLKQLIRKIHISEPVEYVMCLVGKKYPEDRESFRKSRLPGMWDEDRAGKRMKLPTPETWETQVSTKGNKASTWQALIDHNKLPFMAMLRNLRNLVLAGISSKHHQWAIKKLNDERAVINSKQFPFRFFSAYEVLRGLEKIADGEVPPERPHKGKKKKKPKEMPEIDKNLLRKYRTALDNALKISTCHNVKPISGTTLILCNVGHYMVCPCTAAKGLGKPRTVLEVGLLLGLMCKYSCEYSTMLLYGSEDQATEVSLQEGTILDNMEKVMQSAGSSDNQGKIPFTLLTQMLVDRRHFDNVILLTDTDRQDVEVSAFMRKYRRFVNPDLLFVSVTLAGTSTNGMSCTTAPQSPNDIHLSGYSDQILRFIAERGDSGQLTCVQNIDKALHLTDIKIPSLADAAIPDGTDHVLSLSSERALLSSAQGQRWRTVRVFISSTFRDMHGERDLLTRFVFPELRARAHSRQIHVYEVDLRWGVTEQDTRSHKSLEICLEEISRSQYFIGLLGQRYGWIQDQYQVPDTPDFDWLKDFPARRSITEVEMYHAALHDNDKTVNKAFFCFRDASFIDKVPVRHQPEFESESEEAYEKIEILKSKILTSGLEVYHNYPCQWLGEVEGKPMVGGLESFGQRILYNLWNAIQRDYRDDEMDQDPISLANTQHSDFKESRASNFIGRRSLLQKAKAALESAENKLVLVCGKAGCGKSAFMAALAQEYTQQSHHSSVPVDLVISHFIGAAPGSSNVALLLTRICHELKRRFEVSRDVPDDYTDLAREWVWFLEESASHLGRLGHRIVIMIDGVDLLEEKYNARSLDWIPEDIPDGVVLLVSGVEGGMGVKSLRKRKPPPAEVIIGPLDIFDKAEMVRKKLLKYRKTLDESPFNNQMKVLLTKKEAVNPLFLHLACEELRCFGIFEEVMTYLKKMPSTISNLLQEILQRLEVEHTAEILSVSMILLTVVRNGLLEYELIKVLQLALNSLHPDQHEGVLTPMAVSKLLRSLQSFLQPTGQDTRDNLTLAHKDIEKAVKLRYTRGASSRKETQLHLLLATFFRAEADPDGNNTFKGQSARAFTELPHHLMEAGAWKELQELVCNINFVIAKCQLGLAHQLLEDYTPTPIEGSAVKTREVSKFTQQPMVLEYKSFVSRNLHILLKTPSLALQQALNEPECSVVARASRDARHQYPVSMMVWRNKPSTINPCQMNISNQQGAILCVAVSPDSSHFATGFKNGAVKVYEVATGRETHTFIGHAAGITAVCFVGMHRVCSASRDSTLSLWDTRQGIRLATLKGHSRTVHGCAADQAGNRLVSVSWDTHVKVWEGKSGKLLSTLSTQGQRNMPINCVAFHPEGQLVVVGSWDTRLKIWDTFNQKRLKVLKGHKSSIQACSYAPSGRHIVSAALDGEVRVWSTRSGTTVGIITGHHSPVNDIAFTPNGQFLATASSDKVVKVWSGSLGQPVTSIGCADMGYVHQVVFDHETQSLSVGYHDGHIRQFNMQTGAEMAAVKLHSSPIVGLAHHKNLLHMAAYADGTIHVCSLNSPSKTINLKGHTSPITCAIWGRNSFASASEDFYIFMWPYHINMYTKLLQGKSKAPRGAKGKAAAATASAELFMKPLKIIKTQHTGKITAIAFSCDNIHMAVTSRDKSISIWNTISRQLVKVLHDCHKDWITTCCYSDSSSNILFTGSADFTLKVWDVESGSEKATFKGHTSAITSIDVSQGCVASAGFDGCVKVWTHRGVEITTVSCHKQRVNTCLLQVPSKSKANQPISSWADEDEEEGKPVKVELSEVQVITGSDDGTVGVWKPFLPNEITALIGHSDHVLSISSTLNNQFLTSSTDGSIRMWKPPLSSTPGLTLRTTTAGHTGPVTAISAVNTSEEGSLLAVSGGRDGFAMVWEVTLEKVAKLYQVKPTDKGVSSVCFTSYQAQTSNFLTGSDDGVLNCYQFDKKTMSHSTFPTQDLKSLPVSKLVMSRDHNTIFAGSWCRKMAAIDRTTRMVKIILPNVSHDESREKMWIVDIAIVGNTVYSLGLANNLGVWTVGSGNSTHSCTSLKVLDLKTVGEEGQTYGLSLCEVHGTDYLAVSDSHGKVSLWNRVKKKIELAKKLHSQQVNVVCPVSSCCFMTGSDDATVKVWQVEKKGRVPQVTQVAQFCCQACVTAISAVPGDDKNKQLFVVGDSLGHVTILQWEV